MSKHLSVGPGGTRCVCCFPAPGSKSRKLKYRRAKRKEEREAVRIERDNLSDEDTQFVEKLK